MFIQSALFVWVVVLRFRFAWNDCELQYKRLLFIRK